MAPKVCALRMARPGPSPPSALEMTLSGRQVLMPEALVKVADRQRGGITSSRGPGLLVLPRGEPNTGDRIVSSLKCPKLLRGGWVTEATELLHRTEAWSGFCLLRIRNSVTRFKDLRFPSMYIIYINLYRMHKYKHMGNLSMFINK